MSEDKMVNMLDGYAAGFKDCAAIKDAEIEGLIRKAKCYSALELQSKAEIAARDLMIKEFVDRIEALLIGHELPDFTADMLHALLAKSEHHNSRALEKMLLEAEIDGLINTEPSFNIPRLGYCKAKLAELNKE